MFAEVLDVSAPLDYPVTGAKARATLYTTVLLKVCLPPFFSNNGTEWSSNNICIMYLVLFDDQIHMSRLWSTGDALFIFRPWLSAHTEEIGVFGGTTDFTRQAIGYSVNIAQADHIQVASKNDSDGGALKLGFHLCVGAITCVSRVVSPSESKQLDIHLPRRTSRNRVPCSGSLSNVWGRILRLVYVPQQGVIKNGSNRVVTILAEMLLVRDSAKHDLPVLSECRRLASTQHRRSLLCLQCRKGDLPGEVEGGVPLKPGQIAFFSPLIVQKVRHINGMFVSGYVLLKYLFSKFYLYSFFNSTSLV